MLQHRPTPTQRGTPQQSCGRAPGGRPPALMLMVMMTAARAVRQLQHLRACARANARRQQVCNHMQQCVGAAVLHMHAPCCAHHSPARAECARVVQRCTRPSTLHQPCSPSSDSRSGMLLVLLQQLERSNCCMHTYEGAAHAHGGCQGRQSTAAQGGAAHSGPPHAPPAPQRLACIAHCAGRLLPLL